MNRFEIRNIKQEQYNGQDHGMDEQVPITHVAPNQPQPYLSNGPASPILPPGLNNVSETNRDFKGLLQVRFCNVRLMSMQVMSFSDETGIRAQFRYKASDQEKI